MSGEDYSNDTTSSYMLGKDKAQGGGASTSDGSASVAGLSGADFGAGKFIEFGDAIEQILTALDMRMAEAGLTGNMPLGLGSVSMDDSMHANPALDGVDQSDYKFFGEPQSIITSEMVDHLQSEVSMAQQTADEGVRRAETATNLANTALAKAVVAQSIAKQAMQTASANSCVPANPAVAQSDAESPY